MGSLFASYLLEFQCMFMFHEENGLWGVFVADLEPVDFYECEPYCVFWKLFCSLILLFLCSPRNQGKCVEGMVEIFDMLLATSSRFRMMNLQGEEFVCLKSIILLNSGELITWENLMPGSWKMYLFVFSTRYKLLALKAQSQIARNNWHTFKIFLIINKIK